MTPAATLSWFAHHEIRLAWRDWAQMLAGGRTKKERAVMIGGAIIVALLHWLAYALLKPLLATADLHSKATLVMLTAAAFLSFSMMLSQAIEQVTRAFYARADLDLILSSPASGRHLFAVRICAVSVSGAMMSAVMLAPIVNVAAYLDGVRWLAAYLVIVALSALATAIAVVSAVWLFQSAGPKRTRLIAQIIAAVVGAALLIGLQVAGIMLYDNMSRIAVLNSSAFVAAMPGVESAFWLPAHALLGTPSALFAMLFAGLAALAAAIAYAAPQFASYAIAAAGASDAAEAQGGSRWSFRTTSTAQALRAKEWLLLKRDPWLMSQTLMQILYLIPPALLLWRDMGPNTNVHVILAPVLVMAFGQLAGGLAWLAISGEDAPDLVATAPVTPRQILQAKVTSVLAVIAVVALPLTAALTLASPFGAVASLLGIAAASGAAIAIQLWFKSTARRSQFRRRQTASKAATFAEAFSSISWAGAAGCAAAGTWFAALFVGFALLTLWVAWLISPRGEGSGV